MTREEANRLLNAYIDGELDPAKTLELEAHLAESPSLRAACGRLDYIGAQPVAVLVYKRRQHVIDVFVWPVEEQKAGQTLTRDGFNIEHFAKNGMGFWLVSDLSRGELDELARRLAERSAAP